MRTLQEKYNAVLEGNFSKTQFRRDAAMELPQFISNVNSFDDTVAILKNKGIVTEAFGDEYQFGDTTYGDNQGLEVKSLAKQLYLGFKKMGARVRLDANRKKSPMGAEWGKDGLDQIDVLIWVGDSHKGYIVTVDLIGDKAMSFVDKIMNDPKFSKFEFSKREIKTWGGQKGTELTVKPKATRKGAVSVTEAKNQEPKYSTAKPADQVAPDVLDTGIKFELDKKYGTLDVTPEQYEKCREMAIKNLAKDVLYYVKQDSIQLETPAEQMEKVSLKEETDVLFARKLKAAGHDYNKMMYDLGDAVADGKGLEGASAEELRIYAQIAARLGDDIDVTNAFEYLESLPNYNPEFTPERKRQAAEAIQNIENDEYTVKRIAKLTNQLLQDNPEDHSVKAYAISIKNDLESGDASRLKRYKDLLSIDDLKKDMEHYISHDVDQLEENQYSISDIQSKFPDRAFKIQQAAVKAVGARDVEAAYSKSAGEFEQALYKAAHGNLEEDQDFTLTPDEREEKEREKFASYSTGKERKALKEMFKKIIVNLINE